MKPLQWVNIISSVLATAFLALVFHGAYQWYFRKPVPVVQNTYQNYTIAGNMTQENKPEVKTKDKKWGIGGNVNSDKTVGVSLTYFP